LTTITYAPVVTLSHHPATRFQPEKLERIIILFAVRIDRFFYLD